jgi:hypothetical protein
MGPFRARVRHRSLEHDINYIIFHFVARLRVEEKLKFDLTEWERKVVVHKDDSFGL